MVVLRSMPWDENFWWAGGKASVVNRWAVPGLALPIILSMKITQSIGVIGCENRLVGRLSMSTTIAGCPLKV